MGWKGELNIDSRIMGLLKGLLIDQSGKLGDRNVLALVHITQDGIKWTTCFPPHSSTAYLFLPRSTFHSFESSFNADMFCISLSALLDLLSETSRSGIHVKLDWSPDLDYLCVNWVGSDGARISCKLSTFEPFPTIVGNLSPFPNEAFRIIMTCDQYKAAFTPELRQGEKIRVRAGDTLFRLSLNFVNGTELCCTFSDPQCWVGLQCHPSGFEAAYRTTCFLVISSSLTSSDKVVIRCRDGDALCEIQVFCALNSAEQAFLHYTFPALAVD